MIEEEECPHGMENSAWCSICKNKGALVLELDGQDDEYDFIAKYSGYCRECKSDIDPGDMCRHLETGQNVHKACA